jgi:RimJ/RimL family protein N-acetyltransferase
VKDLIRTPRLDLVLMTPAFMRAMTAGRWEAAGAEAGAPVPDTWREVEWRWLKVRLGQLAADPSAGPWLTRLMMFREPARAIVGNAGFHGPPGPEGWAEIGYQVVPEHRRQGYARETAEGLLSWAQREHGITRFRASIGPWNKPSLRLVESLGFVKVGRQWDREDGEELVFELSLGRTTRSALGRSALTGPSC